MIEQTTIEGRDYFTAIERGVEYTANRDTVLGGWCVYSHRLAYGRGHIGGVKRYPSAEALAAGCKAFRSLPALLEAAPVTTH